MMPERRADVSAVDLRRLLPAWARRRLALPGHRSVRPFEDIAIRASRQAGDAAVLRDDDLRGSPDDAPEWLLALAAEAASRGLGHDPFQEQLVAAAALHVGLAVEMDTGEGKTLAGAIAAATLAMSGHRVHVLTVNDYLAERDAEWMRPVHAALGLSSGHVAQSASTDERRKAYQTQIVYVSASEVGYDVLRDRLATSDADRVLPRFDAAIVDEADAVMIDDAMIPLVLAGEAPDAAHDLVEATRLVHRLMAGRDFTVDSDHATASLTDAGFDAVERALGGINLFEPEHAEALTRINLALHALVLVQRDVDYVVTDGQIGLINTARGRIARQQRWPDGLHAAVEVKEGLTVTPPGEVLDSITIQDLLSLYPHRSGMSGTVRSVAEELLEFYRLPTTGRSRHSNDAPTTAPSAPRLGRSLCTFWIAVGASISRCSPNCVTASICGLLQARTPSTSST